MHFPHFNAFLLERAQHCSIEPSNGRRYKNKNVKSENILHLISKVNNLFQGRGNCPYAHT